jgi:hypothetical protein
MSSQLFDKLTQYTVRHIGLVAMKKRSKKKKQKQQERIEANKKRRLEGKKKQKERREEGERWRKEKQRQLVEELVPPGSLGWRQTERGLEMDGTITKLRTMVDEFAKKFEGKIMHNNIEITLGSYEFKKKARYTNGGLKADEKFITLDKFTNNLKHINGSYKYRLANKVGTFVAGINQEDLVTVPPEINIYNDITPILTTMLGVMKKQQDEIKNLQEQLDKC